MSNAYSAQGTPSSIAPTRRPSELPAGYELLAQRRPVEAAAVFRQALATAPEGAAWHGLAESHLALGELDTAIAAFDSAVALAPTAWMSLLARADAVLLRDGLDGWHSAIDHALTVPVVPPAAYHFLVRKAALHWINGRAGLCETIIQSLTHALQREGEPLARFLQGYTMSTAFHLTGLLRHRRQVSPGMREDEANLPAIHLMGDSHCVGPAGTVVRWDHQRHRVSPVYVLGLKAWHLASPHPNPYAVAFRNSATRLPPGAPALICAGDIDCRWRSGIFNHHRKTGTELESSIAFIITGYLDTVQKVCGGRPIGILAPPAPDTATLSWTSDDRALVTRIVTLFQQQLRLETAARGLRLVDTYTVSLGGRHHVDAYHLDMSALSAAMDLVE
jgi:hypothetical protein